MKAVAFHFYFIRKLKLFLFYIYYIVRKKTDYPVFLVYIFNDLLVPFRIYKKHTTNFIIIAHLFYFI